MRLSPVLVNFYWGFVEGAWGEKTMRNRSGAGAWMVRRRKKPASRISFSTSRGEIRRWWLAKRLDSASGPFRSSTTK